MEKNLIEGLCDKMKGAKFTRSQFIKSSALLGGSSILLNKFDKAYAKIEEDGYELAKAENIINSVCLQCNTGCGIKVKLLDGLAVKIDGNPYSPWTMWPHIPSKTSIQDAAAIDGHICPKGQSGIQTLYDPYRIRRVLKRAGKRGENKWVSISLDQAVKEIVNGGEIFAPVPAEKTRTVEGP